MKISITLILILVMCFGFISKAQTKSNLELIDSLISTSINEIKDSLGKNEKTFVEIIVPSTHEILKGKFYKHITNKLNLVADKENSSQQISCYLDLVKVTYSQPQKENFFGDFYVDRKIDIVGNIVIKNQNFVKTLEIKKSLSDKINLDEIKNVEEESLPFTKSEIPNIPLFTNFCEPIIVIGTLVVSTVLLFVVRSK